MKIVRCLLIASQALVFVACAKKGNLPERKIGDVCYVEWELQNVGVLGGAPSTAPIDEDFTFSLSLPYYSNRFTNWIPGEEPKENEYGKLLDENVEYVIKLENIHVFIGGKEYKDSYDFYYLDNNTNEFVIKSKYMVNDVKIVISATKREQELSQYAVVFSDSLDKRVDKTDHLTNPDTYPNEGADIKVTFTSVYQNKMYPIKLFNKGKQKAFPVIEHDGIEIIFETDTAEGLPTDIQLRTGAHFGVLDVDYSRQYTKDNKKCVFTIPKYIVRDHVVISINGEVD